jgi:cation:H+ antiporter
VEHVALFVAGLVLLAVGAPALVFGTARLDRATGRGVFAVGAVAACFGPCVAGLAFNLATVLRQPPVTRLAVGHLVGSTVASLGLVLGAATLARPIAARGRLFYTALPLAIAATLLFWFLARNTPVSRVDAGYMIAAGLVALVLLIRAAREETEPVKAEFASWVPERTPVLAAAVLVLMGLSALVGGAYLTASELTPTATHLRAPSVVLGGTMGAFATALPTAAAAVIASRRGRSDLVLGLVVGPVIINLLLVAGAVAMVRELVIDQRIILEVIPVMGIFALLLLPVAFNGLHVPRWEGVLLLAAYVGFVCWLVFGLTPKVPLPAR